VSVRVTTEPTIEPVSLDELKRQLRRDDSDEDTDLEFRIRVARKMVEKWEWRSHITQTVTATMDGRSFRDYSRRNRALYLPYPPLQSVTSVSYLDDDGVTQTWSATEWDYDARSQPGRLYLSDIGLYDWPDYDLTRHDAITVIYVAGWGDDPEDVPADTRYAILRVAAELDRFREGVTDQRISEIPRGIDALLNTCHDCRVMEWI
jgi:uncharacterized phiE125 gp8 family phage protein